MKLKPQTIIYISIIVAALSLLVTVGVLAGSIDSPDTPANTSSYGLDDIYNRLYSGAAGTSSTWAEPAAGPGSTMNTLNDIMGAAPAVDNTNGATAADVASGKTAWGLTSGAWGVITGTGTIATYAAAVPKTGQTTCYDASGTEIACTGTGQDGDLQKGVTWPNPRFTDNGDGTVTDNLTGLIWLKNANCASATKDWATALSYSNALYDGCTNCFGTAGDCGLSDSSTAGQWRLPNVRELQSLVHYGVYDPAVPNTAGTGKWAEGDPFTGVQSDDYWSSTTFASPSLTNYAWHVSLYYGFVNYTRKTYNVRYVWPVRGGQ